MPKLVILLLGIVFTVCGCWDAKDVDRLAFPIAAAYDVHQGDPQGLDRLSQGPREEPQVDVTVLNPNLSPTAQASVTVETMPAATVALSRDKRSYTVSEIYVTGFNRVLILGEELASQGFMPIVESTYRFPAVSLSVRWAVVEGRGEEILKLPSPNYENMGVYLLNMLSDTKGNSFIPTVTGHQVEIWQNPGKNPILPLLVRGGSNNIIIGGLAVFKKDRLIAKVDTRQARALMLLRGIPSQGYLSFFLPEDGSRAAAFVRNSRKVRVERQGDHFIFNIMIELEGSLEEHPSPRIIDSVHNRELEELLAREALKECLELLKTVQEEWKVDCLDISKYALARWRKELKDKVDQEEFIRQAEIKVDVKARITNSGERR